MEAMKHATQQRPWHQFRVLFAAVGTLASCAASAFAAPTATRDLAIPGLNLQVRVPADWIITRTVPGHGAVIGPRDDDGPSIEILTWEPLAEKLSASAAGQAHEQVLAARMSYTHLSAEPFVAADRSPSVVVTGTVRTPEGMERTALFAAYLFGRRYYVMGLFCEAGQVADIRRELFDVAARTLSPLGTPLPASAMAAVPEPRVVAPSSSATAPVPILPSSEPGPTQVGPLAAGSPLESPRTALSGNPAVAPPRGTPVTPPVTLPTADVSPSTDAPGGRDAPPLVATTLTGTALAEPAQVGTAVPASPPTTPSVTVPPVESPAPVAPPSRLLQKLVSYQDKVGFALQTPADWNVSVQYGCLFAWPTTQPRDVGLVVWPVVRTRNAPLEERAAQVLADLAGLLGGRWKPRESRLLTGQDVAALCTGELEVDKRPLQAVAMLLPGQGADVLEVALAHAEVSDEDRAALAVLLAGVELPRDWSVRSLDPAGAGWSDPGGALAGDGQAGWLTRGSLRMYNGVPAIDVEGRHLLTGARFWWRQPEVPAYKDLTDALAQVGWREGAQFPPDRGMQPLVLRKRPSVSDLARSLANSEGARAQSIASSPVAGNLLVGGEGVRAELVAEGMEGALLGAVASAPRELGADTWLAGSMGYLAPTGSGAQAGDALRRAVLSVRLQNDWQGSAEDRAAVQGRLAGAARVAALLPTVAASTTPTATTVPVLTTLVPGDSSGHQVSLAADLSWPWRSGPSASATGAALPELRREWWSGVPR